MIADLKKKLQRLSNNNCPKFSDKEIISIYLWGKAQQLPTRKAIYWLVKQTMLDLRCLPQDRIQQALSEKAPHGDHAAQGSEGGV